jgi:hypothetical protein
MATATVTYKEVRPIESVTLTLNEDEVIVLTAILNRIGGCFNNSPRKYASNILNAIGNSVDRENMEYGKVTELVDYTKSPGYIYFGDYT